MFIIYFNDQKDSISYCDIFQYAGDTIILFADKDVTKIENALNKNMSSIGNYSKVNELLLNLKKRQNRSHVVWNSSTSQVAWLQS